MQLIQKNFQIIWMQIDVLILRATILFCALQGIKPIPQKAYVEEELKKYSRSDNIKKS